MKSMRRQDRATTREQALQILAAADYGVLSMVDEQGMPYAVPLNYALVGEGTLYFHCATQGMKLDCIAREPRVCFTAVSHARIVPEQLSTKYESAIATGTARLVTEEDERLLAIEAITRRLCPDFVTKGLECMARSGGVTALVRIDIDALSGKVCR